LQFYSRVNCSKAVCKSANNRLISIISGVSEIYTKRKNETVELDHLVKVRMGQRDKLTELSK